MSGDKAVQEQTCKICREETANKFARDTKRLNAHSEDITDLKGLTREVVLLQKAQAKTLEMQTAQLDEQRKTNEAVEQRLQKLEAAAALEKSEQAKPKFWQTDTGKFTIKAAVIAALLTLAVALGQNVDFSIKDLLK